MISDPYFSIIIPTYNRAHLIGKTLETVLQQRFTDFEVLVVDDGSKDNTAEVVRGFADSRVQYFRKDNGERGAARNFGARHAKGTYLNFFDSDDLMYANHLEAARRWIETQGNPEIFHLGYDFKTPEGEVTKKVDQLTGDVGKMVRFDNFLSCNGVFVRRDIALLSPFEENRALASAEDWELWVRLLSRYQLTYSNEITSSVVGHDQRSIRSIAANKVIDRDLLLIKKFEQDERVQKFYGDDFRKFVAQRYTFIMLCLAEEKKRSQVILWAARAIGVYPLILFSRRFLGSLKNIVS